MEERIFEMMIRIFDHDALSFDQHQHMYGIAGFDRKGLLKPMPGRFDEFQLMKTGTFFLTPGSFLTRFKMIDQVVVDPLGFSFALYE